MSQVFKRQPSLWQLEFSLLITDILFTIRIYCKAIRDMRELEIIYDLFVWILKHVQNNNTALMIWILIM